MTTPCHEIVSYRVKDSALADTALSQARALVAGLPGFLSWTPLRGEGGLERVDHVIWRNGAHAREAGRSVAEDPSFAPFRATIEVVHHMGHYVPRDSLSEGVEIARFHLKTRVTEAEMVAAHDAMVRKSLSTWAGWRGHEMLALGEGHYLLLCRADSLDRARKICQGWIGDPACEAFLALITAEDMVFGQPVTS
jgi:heme-degrading monooxygenase HmoA